MTPSPPASEHTAKATRSKFGSRPTCAPRPVHTPATTLPSSRRCTRARRVAGGVWVVIAPILAPRGCADPRRGGQPRGDIPDGPARRDPARWAYGTALAADRADRSRFGLRSRSGIAAAAPARLDPRPPPQPARPHARRRRGRDRAELRLGPDARAARVRGRRPCSASASPSTWSRGSSSRPTPTTARNPPARETAPLIGLILLGVGVLWLGGRLVPSGDIAEVIWPLTLIGGGIAVLVIRSGAPDASPGTDPAGFPPEAGPPAPAGPETGPEPDTAPPTAASGGIGTTTTTAAAAATTASAWAEPAPWPARPAHATPTAATCARRSRRDPAPTSVC